MSFETTLLKDILQSTGLDVSDHDSVQDTSDDGAICLLSRFGCVARLTHQDRLFTNKTPVTLQPLLRREVDEFFFDINPGLDMAEDIVDTSEASIRFLEYGVRLWDISPENIGFIPNTNQLVILDLDNEYIRHDLSCLSRSAKQVLDLIQNGTYHSENPQDRLYSVLRELFNAAWPEDSESVDILKMCEAWEACIEAKESGDLRADWQISSDWDDFSSDVDLCILEELDSTIVPAPAAKFGW